MTREEAIQNMHENNHPGWTELVNIVFDNKPDHIKITEVFQKWSWLQVRYEGEDNVFKDLCKTIQHMSQFMCEVCGKSGGYTIINGWETTLCDEHFEKTQASEKYRRDDPVNRA